MRARTGCGPDAGRYSSIQCPAVVVWGGIVGVFFLYFWVRKRFFYVFVGDLHTTIGIFLRTFVRGSGGGGGDSTFPAGPAGLPISNTTFQYGTERWQAGPGQAAEAVGARMRGPNGGRSAQFRVGGPARWSRVAGLVAATLSG